MATIKEDYVSFGTAKLLKEKGFPLPSTNFKDWVFCMYDENGDIQWGCYNPEWYVRVTLQMAMKWLREVHNINIDIVPIWNQKRFEYQVFVVTPENAKHCYIDDKLYFSYEKACEEAIKYCLENLI